MGINGYTELQLYYIALSVVDSIHVNYIYEA
jgi:hypothetical protein